jgi:hypothetical protein
VLGQPHRLEPQLLGFERDLQEGLVMDRAERDAELHARTIM